MSVVVPGAQPKSCVRLSHDEYMLVSAARKDAQSHLRHSSHETLKRIPECRLFVGLGYPPTNEHGSYPPCRTYPAGKSRISGLEGSAIELPLGQLSAFRRASKSSAFAISGRGAVD